MEPLNEKLEAYKLINSRLDSEVHEFYSINNLYLLIQTLGIFGTIAVIEEDSNSILTIVPILILAVTAWHWKGINTKAKIWRDAVLEEAKELEREGVLGEYKFWNQTGRETFISARGVWKDIMRLPDIFLFTWLALLIYILFLNGAKLGL